VGQFSQQETEIGTSCYLLTKSVCSRSFGALQIMFGNYYLVKKVHELITFRNPEQLVNELAVSFQRGTFSTKFQTQIFE
jgi:hypothetical protein